MKQRKRTLKKEPKNLKQYIEQHYQELYKSVIYSIHRRYRHDAEELVSKGLNRCVLKAHTYKGALSKTDVVKWCRRVAINEAHTHSKNMRKRAERLHEQQWTEYNAKPESDPLNQVQVRDFLEHVDLIVQSMSPSFQQCVVDKALGNTPKYSTNVMRYRAKIKSKIGAWV